jgi:hypothetical protein
MASRQAPRAPSLRRRRRVGGLRHSNHRLAKRSESCKCPAKPPAVAESFCCPRTVPSDGVATTPTAISSPTPSTTAPSPTPTPPLARLCSSRGAGPSCHPGPAPHGTTSCHARTLCGPTVRPLPVSAGVDRRPAGATDTDGLMSRATVDQAMLEGTLSLLCRREAWNSQLDGTGNRPITFTR